MRNCSNAPAGAHTLKKSAVADSGRAENDILAIRQIVRCINAVEILFVAFGNQAFSLLFVARPHSALHVSSILETSLT